MFLKTLASKVQSAEARGLVPDMEEYLPPRPGEVVIGTVTDPGLLALIYVYNSEAAEFFMTWPVPPTDKQAMKAALTAGADIETLKDIVFAEIRDAFRMGPDDESILRQGYGGPLVVTPAPPDVVDGLTKAADAKVQVIRKAREAKANALFGMLAALTPPCGDPDCPMHGYTELARRERQLLLTYMD